MNAMYSLCLGDEEPKETLDEIELLLVSVPHGGQGGCI